MSIELKKFQRTRVVIMATQYIGPKMDIELYEKFKNDFCHAYDYQGGKYLCCARRGLKNPHREDWLIFDEKMKNLIDVMPNDLFQKTYDAAREV